MSRTCFSPSVRLWCGGIGVEFIIWRISPLFGACEPETACAWCGTLLQREILTIIFAILKVIHDGCIPYYANTFCTCSRDYFTLWRIITLVVVKIITFIDRNSWYPGGVCRSWFEYPSSLLSTLLSYPWMVGVKNNQFRWSSMVGTTHRRLNTTQLGIFHHGKGLVGCTCRARFIFNSCTSILRTITREINYSNGTYTNSRQLFIFVDKRWKGRTVIRLKLQEHYSFLSCVFHRAFPLLFSLRKRSERQITTRSSAPGFGKRPWNDKNTALHCHVRSLTFLPYPDQNKPGE